MRSVGFLFLLKYSLCAPRPYVYVSVCRPDELVVPKEDPLAHEISDVLREWNVVWKRLYAVSL